MLCPSVLRNAYLPQRTIQTAILTILRLNCLRSVCGRAETEYASTARS
ncbi:MAG: hypothetical protein ACTS73_09980 [Arsenophonus sp. NEOnobi-MAG3]